MASMRQTRRQRKYNPRSRAPAETAKYRTQMRVELSGEVVCFPSYSKPFHSYPSPPIPPEPKGGIYAAAGPGLNGLSGGGF